MSNNQVEINYTITLTIGEIKVSLTRAQALEIISKLEAELGINKTPNYPWDNPFIPQMPLTPYPRLPYYPNDVWCSTKHNNQ